MAHINLLPWREERRQERQQQFYIALGAGFVFAAIILYLVVSYADGLIDEQNQRNAFLQQEIVKLDRKIKEIKDLETERAKLIARMDVIQNLQESRPKIVKDFDAIVRTVPEGIQLVKMSRVGNVLSFDGDAESNARVSVFMRELDKNPEFGESTLNVIQKASSKKNGSDVSNVTRSFTVQVKELQQKTENGEK